MSTDPGHLEVTGLATIALLFLSIPFQFWENWKLGTEGLVGFLDGYAFAIRLSLLVLGGGTGLYTLVRAWPILRNARRPMPHRLSAGYGFSYAAFAILAAGIPLAYAASLG